VKRALVIYGSPRGEQGQTARLMEPFLAGIEAAGAAVERLFAYRLRISPCLGCYTCWVRTPGTCAQADENAPKQASVALLSTCGFADPENFEPLIAHVKAICENLSWRYAGALTVPGNVRRERYPQIGEAARRAGRLAVETGIIPRELEEVMHQDLIPVAQFSDRFNAGFQQAIDTAGGRAPKG
jgi:hypothetical protein